MSDEILNQAHTEQNMWVKMLFYTFRQQGNSERTQKTCNDGALCLLEDHTKCLCVCISRLV